MYWAYIRLQFIKWNARALTHVRGSSYEVNSTCASRFIWEKSANPTFFAVDSPNQHMYIKKCWTNIIVLTCFISHKSAVVSSLLYVYPELFSDGWRPLCMGSYCLCSLPRGAALLPLWAAIAKYSFVKRKSFETSLRSGSWVGIWAHLARALFLCAAMQCNDLYYVRCWRFLKKGIQN